MIYLYLFIEFFKIGLFTFGGGYAMIPLVREVVISYGWMTEETFSNFIIGFIFSPSLGIFFIVFCIIL